MLPLLLTTTVLKSWPITFFCAFDQRLSTTCIKKDLSSLLLNDELLCNQSSLYYHYLSQLLYSNLGKLRSIVLVIMDRAQLVQKRICADFLLIDEPLCNQSGFCYHYPSLLPYSNLGQLRFIGVAITDRR